MRVLRRIPDALIYHYRQSGPPLHILKAMWQRGQQPTASIVRDAVAYAHEVLGSRRYVPWLVAQSTFRGTFLEGWVTANYVGDVVAPRINRPFGTAAAKTFAAKILPADLLPDLGYLIDGVFYDRAYRPCSAQAFQRLLFAEHDTVMMKLDGSGSGKDVQCIERTAFSRVGSIAGRRRAVFQHVVTQHALFDAYCDGGATVRINTVREPDGTASVRSLAVRFPPGTSRIIGQGDSYQVFLTLDAGTPHGPAVTNSWDLLETHPERGSAFADCRLPDVGAVLRMVLAQHAALPHFGLIAWDVMIDRDGRSWIIEWNTDYPSVSTSEAVTGPNYRGLDWERLHQRSRGSA